MCSSRCLTSDEKAASVKGIVAYVNQANGYAKLASEPGNIHVAQADVISGGLLQVDQEVKYVLAFNEYLEKKAVLARLEPLIKKGTREQMMQCARCVELGSARKLDDKLRPNLEAHVNQRVAGVKKCAVATFRRHLMTSRWRC